MTRIVTILTGALLALTMSSIPEAQACISCSYTPEVAGSPAKAAPQKRAVKPAARPQAKQSNRVEREARPKSNRGDDENKVARKPEPKAHETVEQEKSVAEPATKVEPAKTAEPEKPSESTVTETTEAQSATQQPATTASRALSEADAALAARNDQPQTPRSCKKYLPDARMTITVPCE